MANFRRESSTNKINKQLFYQLINLLQLMLKKIPLLCLFLFAVSISAFGKSRIIVSGEITGTVNWVNTNTYELRGFVYVIDGAVLNIQVGTRIEGDKASKGTLIVERGGRVYAIGTSTSPIVFTSKLPAGQRSYGDWGGVIICGRATTNQPGGEAQIEGGPRSFYGGGASPNDNDTSGVLNYVRIEFPGIPLAPNNEINGLTMGGVGRGTVIDYVQVSYSGDDSFEWFGGTVNCSHLIALRGLDDDWDTDNGFSGKVQFGVSLRDPAVADVSGSNGFESDNDASGSTNSPRTQVQFSNMTEVGPSATNATSVNSNYRRVAHIRRSTQMDIFNSILTGWGAGNSSMAMILLDGANVQTDATNGEVQIHNTITEGNAPFLSASPTSYNTLTWFSNASYNNTINTDPNTVGLADPFNLTNPSFVPTNPANVSNADFTGLSGFTVVNYKGAFDPNSARWDAGWSDYDPQGTSGIVSVTANTTTGWNLVSVPVTVTNTADSALFPGRVSGAFAYNNGYVQQNPLQYGTGYWMKFSLAGAGITVFTGQPIDSIIIPVNAGWNIIGSRSASVTVANITSPDGVIIDPNQVFSYTGTSYAVATSILPGKAYWFYANQAGTIKLK